MATKLWADLLPLITPDIPACPEATIKTHLASVTADFCARTQLWRETLDADYTIANIAEYDLDGSAVIEAVQWVVCNQQPLTSTNIQLIPHERLADVGQPTHFWIVNDTILRLFPIPDDRYDLEIGVVLKPSRTAIGVEDWIYETWAETLASGTIARLARIPGKDWTDPMLVEMHRAMYEKAIANVKIRDMRNIPLRIRSRPAA